MYEYDELIQELQEDGYTPEDIEDYIRNEVDKDKVEKLIELGGQKSSSFGEYVDGMMTTGKDKQ